MTDIPFNVDEPAKKSAGSWSAVKFKLKEKDALNISLERLDRELGLSSSDVMLIGDGSGTGNWELGAGWSCAIVDRISSYRHLCHGSWSSGSVLLAELFAYAQGLMTFEHYRGEKLRKEIGRGLTVQILTDSQVLVQQSANALSGVQISAETGPVWALVVSICRNKHYQINFRHIPRLSLTLNCVCDRISREARISALNNSENPVSEFESSIFRNNLQSWNPTK